MTTGKKTFKLSSGSGWVLTKHIFSASYLIACVNLINVMSRTKSIDFGKWKKLEDLFNDKKKGRTKLIVIWNIHILISVFSSLISACGRWKWDNFYLLSFFLYHRFTWRHCRLFGWVSWGFIASARVSWALHRAHWLFRRPTRLRFGDFDLLARRRATFAQGLHLFGWDECWVFFVFTKQTWITSYVRGWECERGCCIMRGREECFELTCKENLRCVCLRPPRLFDICGLSRRIVLFLRYSSWVYSLFKEEITKKFLLYELKLLPIRCMVRIFTSLIPFVFLRDSSRRW